MEGLDAHNVYCVQLSRVLNDDDGGPVKDAITAGLQSLTAGTKSPLSEYNEASCLLLSQTNRKASRNLPTQVQEQPKLKLKWTQA